MKRYLNQSPNTRCYIQRAKGQIQRQLSQRGLSYGDVSAGTGIPRTNLQRWLSIRNEGFMTLGDAAVIRERLGVSVQSLLPCWAVMGDQELAALLRKAEKIPEDHLRSLLECYAMITGGKEG